MVLTHSEGAVRMSGVDKPSILPPSEATQSLPSSTTVSGSMLDNKKIVFKSEVMRQLMRMVDRVAPSRVASAIGP